MPAANDFVEQRLRDLKNAKLALEAARHRQKAYSDRKRREEKFQIGDEVLLSSKNIRLLNPGTPKLLPKWLGPFTIIDYCGNHKTPPKGGDPDNVPENTVAYKLDLPDHMRMHDVFHVSLLKRYNRDRRVQPPPIPIVVDGEERYHVERILDHRDIAITVKKKTKHSPAKVEQLRQYLVKWSGYGDEHNSWEPEESVSELDALKAYHNYINSLPTS